ncbi:hypothetical protein A3153_16675 [Salmonella enterica subsp. enterica serovar Kentucky]|nr:hypothetical protein [Salmonella enterica subsp. enterica serovar Mbandaka]ECT6262178.1 hypothetical protein [Salmonella enterica subsp. enterica serovar Kentucky]EDR7477988.1 hypothetical protein [Salmonella enterica subsp. enterica serovar 4,[5],12:i:-]
MKRLWLVTLCRESDHISGPPAIRHSHHEIAIHCVHKHSVGHRSASFRSGASSFSDAKLIGVHRGAVMPEGEIATVKSKLIIRLPGSGTHLAEHVFISGPG